MSDPAVEAEERAWKALVGTAPIDPTPTMKRYATSAAREALKPVRELHCRITYDSGVARCEECEREWPCDTAKLIFPTEELERREEK